jgi:hypothetical protein
MFKHNTIILKHMDNACIYSRISSKKTSALKYTTFDSIDRQIYECQMYCKSNKFNIFKIINDTVSAFTDFGSKTILDHIKTLPDDTNFIFYRTDRFCRNLDILNELIKIIIDKKIILHSVTEGKLNLMNPNDKHMFVNYVSLANLESEKISERQKLRYKYTSFPKDISKSTEPVSSNIQLELCSEGIPVDSVFVGTEKITDTIKSLRQEGMTCKSVAEFLNEKNIFYKVEKWDENNIEQVSGKKRKNTNITESKRKHIRIRN